MNRVAGRVPGSDAGGDGAEECVDCLGYMISDFKTILVKHCRIRIRNILFNHSTCTVYHESYQIY